MDRKTKILSLSLGVALILCGCLDLKQPRSRIQYYTLEYGTPPMSGLKPIPFVVKVGRFSIAPAYNTNRIIYRDGPFKRDEYLYYKWRSNPADMITYSLSRDMKRSGLFKAVLPYDSLVPFSYTLEGSVDRFFEANLENGWDAVLGLSIILMEENEPDVSKKIVFQKTYSVKKACKQKNPAGLAAAMSRAMEEVSGKIIRDVHLSLKDRVEM